MERFGLPGSTWSISPHSRLFSVHINGKGYDSSTLALNEVAAVPSPEGIKHCFARFDGPGFLIEYHLQGNDGTALVEMWPVIRNRGDRVCYLTRVDSVSVEVPGAGCELLSFDSDWGQEFEPRQVPLLGKICLETHMGKSSKGKHPWFALQRGENAVLSGSIAWSGNWIMHFETGESGNCQISLGLND